MAWCLSVLIAFVHSPQRASPLTGRVKEEEAARHHGKLTDWLPNVGNSLWAADTTHADRQTAVKVLAHNHCVLIYLHSHLNLLRHKCENTALIAVGLPWTQLLYFINGCVNV